MVDPAVTGEWQRAEECLGAAALCRDNGFHADAVSRCYYATMHAAKATLAVRSVQVNSHEGVRNRFGMYLVRTNTVESEWADYIRTSYESRLLADYDVTVNFTEADAREAYTRAQSFLDRMRLLLGNAVPPGTSEAVGDVH